MDLLIGTFALRPYVFGFVAAFLVPLAAFAEEAGKVGANKWDVKTWAAAGAGLAIGLGVLYKRRTAPIATTMLIVLPSYNEAP